MSEFMTAEENAAALAEAREAFKRHYPDFVAGKSEITPEIAAWLLHRADEIKGSAYIYTQEHPVCRNFDNEGNPLCIVGWAMAIAGFTPAENGEPGTCSFGLGVNAWVGSGITPIHPTAALMFSVAQSVQDSGGTWGLAYGAAFSVRSLALRITMEWAN